MQFRENTSLNVQHAEFYCNSNTNHFDQASDDMLNILYSHRAAGSCHDSAERVLPPCYPNTQRAILDHKIASWFTNDREPQMMWLNGPPGFGKSAIAQEIAKSFATQNCLAASFFFTHSGRNGNHLSDLAATIAHSIAVKFPGVRRSIKAALIDKSIFEKTFNTLWTDLVLQPLQFAPWKLLIVIDFIDQCDPHVQEELLECLLNTTQPPRNDLGHKILLSSRPDNYILSTIRNAPLNMVLPHKLEKSSNVKEIETYLTGSFENIFQGEKDKPEPAMIKKFVQNSSGQFLYARTVVDFVLSRKRTNSPLETLKGILQNPFMPFEPLDNLYMTILNRAKEQNSFDEFIPTLFVHRIADMYFRPQHVREELTISDFADFWSKDCSRICSAISALSPLLAYQEDADGNIDPNRTFWFRQRSFVKFIMTGIKPAGQSHPFMYTRRAVSKVALQSIHVIQSRTVRKDLLIRTQQTWMNLCTHSSPDSTLTNELNNLEIRNFYDPAVISQSELDTSFEEFTKWLDHQHLLRYSPSREHLYEARFNMLSANSIALHAVANLLKSLVRTQWFGREEYAEWLSFLCYLLHNHPDHVTMGAEAEPRFVLDYLSSHRVTERDPSAYSKARLVMSPEFESLPVECGPRHRKRVELHFNLEWAFDRVKASALWILLHIIVPICFFLLDWFNLLTGQQSLTLRSPGGSFSPPKS